MLQQKSIVTCFGDSNTFEKPVLLPELFLAHDQFKLECVCSIIFFLPIYIRGWYSHSRYMLSDNCIPRLLRPIFQRPFSLAELFPGCSLFNLGHRLDFDTTKLVHFKVNTISMIDSHINGDPVRRDILNHYPRIDGQYNFDSDHLQAKD